MNKEKIRKWYQEENLSQRQIAKKLGCSQFKVKTLMREYGIKARSFSEAQKINERNPWKHKTEEHKERISEAMEKSWKKNPNQGWKGKQRPEETKRKISNAQIITGQGRNFKEYRKLAEKLFEGKCLKCGARDELCVHHKNGNHYDNKPENLELLCRKCHMSLHRREDLKNEKKLF